MSDGARDPVESAVGRTRGEHSAFLPLLLTLAAFLLILGWTLAVAIRQANDLQAAKFQVWQATAQSAQAEQKLKALLTELVGMAKGDPAAAAIVKRYNITQSTATAAPENRGQ